MQPEKVCWSLGLQHLLTSVLHLLAWCFADTRAGKGHADNQQAAFRARGAGPGKLYQDAQGGGQGFAAGLSSCGVSGSLEL